MKQTSQDSIRRVLTSGFSARDVAEPLVSFDSSTDARAARQRMERADYDVAGVRRDGLVVGYVRQTDLSDGGCGDHLRAIEQEQMIEDAAPLAEVVSGLATQPRLFVSLLGASGGIITREDLAKPPMRMWLFGMVTTVELRFVRLIQRHCPDQQWKQHLSAGRLEKAEQLAEERRRRKQHVELIDCLQLSDKGTILMRNETLRGLLHFGSRREAEQAIKQLESLRNNLAHSQDIVVSDWETIVLLADNLDRVISGPPAAPGLLES